MKVTVEVPEPGAAIEAGLKLTVTPAGTPDAARATAELNPPETAVVMVEAPLLPGATETSVGEAEMVKAGVWVVDPVRASMSRRSGCPSR